MSYSNPQLPPKFMLVRHSPVLSSDPARPGQIDWLQIYKVNGGQEFTVIVPKTKPTPQEVEAAVRADYDHQKQFIGREFV